MRRHWANWRRRLPHWRGPKDWKPMRDRSRCGLALNPRKAVLDMAPYSPPTGGRAGKLRLDFNENTVGCSPRVIASLKERLDAGALTIYPEYTEARSAVAAYFQVPPEQFLFTNGTDEAIQVFINTY